MSLPRLALLLCCIASLTAVATPDKERLKAEIIATEKAFSALAQEKGVVAAFEQFAAPDAVFIDVDPRKWHGAEAVRRRFANAPADLRLSWTPTHVDVSDDGTLAYDYGRYESRRTGADGKVTTRTGFYLTIWKRQPDGAWRYVTDTGAPDQG